MGKEINKEVAVPLWVVVSAIRYGMNRLSYAGSDSSHLAQQFWDDFPEHIREQIRRDVDDEFFEQRNKQYWAWLERR